MQQRDARSVMVTVIALMAMCASVSVQAARPIPCQEQDVAPEPTVTQTEPVARLDAHLRRMHCTALRIMELPTLEDRLPYEEMRITQHIIYTQN